MLATLVSTLYVGHATADSSPPDAEVFFRFDSAWLDDDAAESLDAIATLAKDAPTTKLVIDAHADATGQSPYNVGLSIRRARSVQRYFTQRGLDPARIVIAAYGEDGPRRASRALDRRASVTLTAEPLYSIIDGSGRFVTAVVWNEPVSYAEIVGPATKVERTARR